MNIINLDHLSANPLLPEVQEAMIHAIRADFGNPSSQHKLGDKASEALEKARDSVARLIKSGSPKEVVFTSGGTESVNLGVKGVAWAKAEKGSTLSPRTSSTTPSSEVSDGSR